MKLALLVFVLVAMPRLCVAMPPVAPTQKVHVPQAVLAAFAQKYPSVSKPTWETEKGNYEANWGGSSGEDHAALFTPTGVFVEIVDAIDVRSLPTAVAPYVKSHYEGAKIKEAGKVTDAAGKQTYEIEIHGKDLIFDLQGNFVSEAKG